MGIGFWELLLIFIVIFLIFGGKKVPEIMGDIGKGIRTFKKSMESGEEPLSRPEAATPPKALPSGESGKDNPGASQQAKGEDAPKRDS